MARKYLLVLLFIVFLAGCSSEIIENEADEPEFVEIEKIEPEGDDVIEAEEVLEEIPEEWEGKTIAELLGEQQNGTEENETVLNVMPEGTHLIALQMFGESHQFYPKVLTIKAGDTVRWVNNLDYLNKTAKVQVYAHHNALFRSTMLPYGQYFEFTFEESGEYTFGANPYTALFRVGKVIVE